MIRNIVSQIQVNNQSHPIASSAYGVCQTAASTAAKVVNIQNDAALQFQLITGVTVHIKFRYHNAAQNPTLNINQTGAHPIYRYGNSPIGATAESSWEDYAIISLTYDGNVYIINDYKGDTQQEQEQKLQPYNQTPQSISTSSGDAGGEQKYARGDHRHLLSVSQGSYNGQINIAGKRVKVHGLQQSAYKTVNTQILENQSTNNEVPSVKAVVDYVQTKIPSAPQTYNEFGAITNNNGTFRATSPEDTLTIIGGTHTSVLLNNQSKTVQIGSTLSTLGPSQHSNTPTLVTQNDVYTWNNAAAVSIEGGMTVAHADSDFTSSVSKVIFQSPNASDETVDIIPPDFTFSIFYNNNNGDLQFYSRSDQEVDPSPVIPAHTLILQYNPDNVLDDGAGQLEVTYREED